jgi:hypothetical protein
MGECAVFARYEAEAKATQVVNQQHQQPLRRVLEPADARRMRQ